ncbi:MAG: isoprenyl transferase [Deltaproteobacteria bacterium]|nr:isoprenyl transferase [Deltaproteobacteria bacterium]
MDGNGRWAKKRLLARTNGHERGADTVRAIVRTSREIGIGYLTLYAFSTENWQRPKAEVAALMMLLARFLKSEKNEMLENGIRLNIIGQIDRLPENVRSVIDETLEATARNSRMVLTLALSYGSREEIVRAMKSIAFDVKAGLLDPENVDDAEITRRLYTFGIPDPDLLIRTSGEMRISNFLLWQIAYSEIFITPTLWPDFGRDEYVSILKDYGTRERRFGMTGDQL